MRKHSNCPIVYSPRLGREKYLYWADFPVFKQALHRETKNCAHLAVCVGASRSKSRTLLRGKLRLTHREMAPNRFSVYSVARFSDIFHGSDPFENSNLPLHHTVRPIQALVYHTTAIFVCQVKFYVMGNIICRKSYSIYYFHSIYNTAHSNSSK